MRYAATLVLAGLAAGGAVGSASAQNSSTAFGRQIFALDFTTLPAGQLPSIMRVVRGSLQVVAWNGTAMLRAESPSEFVLDLPEVLPRDFTLEFELVPKQCCNPDLTFEGGNAVNQSGVSAHVLWDADGALEVIGGGDRFSMQMPGSLSASLVRSRSHVALVAQDDNTLRLYSNGQRNFTLPDRRFARAKHLRVVLGGDDDKLNAVYLARVTITEGAATGALIAQHAAAITGAGAGNAPPQPSPAPPAPSVLGVVATVDAQGAGSVSWQAVTGATSYFVVRWLVGDPVCCANMSPPQGMPTLSWQDGTLPKAGTYGYRVYATTPTAIATGETQVQYQGIATGAPRTGTILTPASVSAASPTALPASRDINLSPITGVGPRGLVPAERTINLADITGTGPLITVTTPTSARTGLPGTTSTSTVPAARTITLPGITGLGGFVIPLPRTINLAGWTATGPGLP